MRLLWFMLGAAALLLGIVGIALPGLPTVPFLLLAAFGFARSSTRAHDWLTTHPRLGPPIHDWRANGAIRRRMKWLATASMAAAFAISLILGMPLWALALQALALACVAVFIWTRPEGPPPSPR